MYKSDWLGIGIGVLIGAYQPFVIAKSDMFAGSGLSMLSVLIPFGIFCPPLLALVNKYLPLGEQRSAKFLGKYLNTFFMMIAFGITVGIVGFAHYLIVGGRQESLAMISFFFCAGVGFYFAYLINPALAFRPTKNA